jgi:hypothetical protein
MEQIFEEKKKGVVPVIITFPHCQLNTQTPSVHSRKEWIKKNSPSHQQEGGATTWGK